MGSNVVPYQYAGCILDTLPSRFLYTTVPGADAGPPPPTSLSYETYLLRETRSHADCRLEVVQGGALSNASSTVARVSRSLETGRCWKDSSTSTAAMAPSRVVMTPFTPSLLNKTEGEDSIFPARHPRQRPRLVALHPGIVGNGRVAAGRDDLMRTQGAKSQRNLAKRWILSQSEGTTRDDCQRLCADEQNQRPKTSQLHAQFPCEKRASDLAGKTTSCFPKPIFASVREATKLGAFFSCHVDFLLLRVVLWL